MGFLESIDWEFLQNFYGQYGKIIGTAIAVVVAVVSLIAAIYRYRHTNTIERILGKSADKRHHVRFWRIGPPAENPY